MVVDTGADDLQSIVHVRESEETFALDVGFGDVDGVKSRSVVVEDAEEVVVVADGVAVRGVGVGFGDVGGRLHGGEIGHGAEEAVGWRRRLVWDGWRLVVDVSAEHGGLRLLLDQHRHLVISAPPVQLISPL